MARTTKEKTCDTRKWENVMYIILTGMLVILGLVILCYTAFAIANYEKEVKIQEFEILSCYVETRNKTNIFGGLRSTDQYLHYSYANDDGKVTFGEACIENDLDVRLTEGVSKIIITTVDNNRETYAFELTREFFNALIPSQE